MFWLLFYLLVYLRLRAVVLLPFFFAWLDGAMVLTTMRWRLVAFLIRLCSSKATCSKVDL